MRHADAGLGLSELDAGVYRVVGRADLFGSSVEHGVEVGLE